MLIISQASGADPGAVWIRDLTSGQGHFRSCKVRRGLCLYLLTETRKSDRVVSSSGHVDWYDNDILWSLLDLKVTWDEVKGGQNLPLIIRGQQTHILTVGLWMREKWWRSNYSSNVLFKSYSRKTIGIWGRWPDLRGQQLPLRLKTWYCRLRLINGIRSFSSRETISIRNRTAGGSIAIPSTHYTLKKCMHIYIYPTETVFSRLTYWCAETKQFNVIFQDHVNSEPSN